MNILGKMLLIISLVTVLGLAGCAMFNSTELEYTNNISVGRELVDLKEAMDKGAITEKEYNSLKERIKQGKPMPCGRYSEKIKKEKDEAEKGPAKEE